MDKISMLLQEAKPLYLKRERRKRILEATGGVFSIFLLTFWVGTSFLPKTETVNLYQQIYQVENGSVIEDMGFPVDEYGLLKVS
ncbi:MAG: hypothetical protein PHI50_00255 [Alphaproteobacteria bacterium]|nr:hypothetical protein [Alphaproteobacteria bacterium]